MKGNDAEVVGVVEGQTFKLWCEVVVDQDIDSKVQTNTTSQEYFYKRFIPGDNHVET